MHVQFSTGELTAFRKPQLIEDGERPDEKCSLNPSDIIACE